MTFVRMIAVGLACVSTTLDFRAKAAESASDAPGRVSAGLMALYDFHDAKGDVVRDRSGATPPIDLEIANPKAVHQTPGTLTVRNKTVIRSKRPAARITLTTINTNEITIEAWIRPANTSQNGPARIVTLSRNSGERHFTLGQEKDRFEVRFRTTSTSNNGIPPLSSKPRAATTALTHVVYTRDRKGRTRLYIDGNLNAERQAPGATSNWTGTYRLGLANEISGDRPWRGTFHLVALYKRDLLPNEVVQNFEAGPTSASVLARAAKRSNAHLFESNVAPLLARRCLDCHDSASKKGDLDLSRKVAALRGGESGKPIVPGNAQDSLLWQMVEADEMPKKKPLSADEKKLIKKWLEAGADWTLDVIEPALYEHQEAARNWLRRLTVSEYIETVRAVFGVDVEKEARQVLPADLRADGFSNTAYNLNVDLGHVEAYSRLAEIIVGKLDVKAFARRFSKRQRLTDDDMRALIAKMGKTVYRGPLEEHEIVTLRGISTTVAASGGGFEQAVGYILEAMLQSPRFLYRIENQRGDGSAWPVGEYELACRLSYIIWGAPPDQQLILAVEKGEFYDHRDFDKHIQRMLDDPRAIKRSKQFVSEWLDLGRLKNLRPNRRRFPEWDADLAEDMRRETLAYFEDVVWKQKRPLGDLLNAQLTYATPRLAKFYGLKPRDKGLARYDLSSFPSRGGLLTQGSILTIGGDEASMVARGLFVLQDLLRGSVKDPPPCVDTKPIPTKKGLTQRGISEQRIANNNCGGCHVKFEPLAFGLEKFNGIGKFHEADEHGNKLRDDGEVLFPGTTSPVKYKSVSELMDILAGSERVAECLTWKFVQFSMGRPLAARDAPLVKKIHEEARAAGGSYRDLVAALAQSDLVLKTRTEAP